MKIFTPLRIQMTGISAKLILYTGAIMWSLFLMLPGHMLHRPFYHWMFTLADEHLWATCFAVYGLFGFFRLSGDTKIPVWLALLHNSLGVTLWCGSTSLCAFSVWPPGGAMVGNFVFAVTSIVLLVATPFEKVRD